MKEFERIANSLIDALMLMEDTDNVIERLLDVVSADWLIEQEWFDEADILEIDRIMKEGGTTF